MKRFPKLLAFAAVLALVPAGAALGEQKYMDSAGDAPGGAPDITQVAISHKMAGDVTFQVTFANRQTLTGDDAVVALIDSDQNATTGEGGMDYMILVFGDAPDGALVMPTSGSNTAIVSLVAWANQTMTFTVDKALIGATSAFNFAWLSHIGPADISSANTELVPHSGTLTYSLAVSIVKIQLAKPVTSVKAGKVFTVRGSNVMLSTDELFKPERLTAKAKIGTKTLKPLAGGLSWKIPKAAKGKKLVVTMAASYQGMAKAQKQTFKIK